MNNLPMSMIAPEMPESAMMFMEFRDARPKLEEAEEQKLVPCIAVWMYAISDAK